MDQMGTQKDAGGRPPPQTDQMHLYQIEVEYLNLMIKDGKVHMDSIRLKVVHDWELPTSVKAVRSFIRFCNFY